MSKRIVARYLLEHFAVATGVVLMLLLILFGFLSFTEALEDVGKGTFRTTDAISIVLLSLPAIMLDVLPVAVLLGSIIGLGNLANHQELIAMRAAGVSKAALVWVFFGIGVVLGAAIIAIQLFLIPVAEHQVQEFKARALTQTARGGGEFWSRDGTRVIHVGSVEFGRVPTSIEIYELDQHHRLSELITAAKAEVVSRHKWRLIDATTTVIASDDVNVTRSAELEWDSFLNPQQMQTLITAPEALSVLELHQFLQSTAQSGVDNRLLESLYWQKLSLPAAVLAMLLLGLPVAISAIRPRTTGVRVVIGGSIGILFYLLQQFSGQATELFGVAPPVAAFLPTVVILAITFSALNRQH